ncbi:uncharacterized protein A4U43_C06F8550 [Asparagus officinalis]|uniref:Uncharacterized protein n=1 Tax=Asparagus officinalis TaxID=4686 RepID=A0A5P1EKF1_ASPOF|nr:uncharacterized protein A4U43_C06F8550 [Asparagus officinalis]
MAKNGAGMINRGYIFVAKGDLQQASSFFKIVLDEDPNNIPALLGLGQVQLKLGDFRSSLSSFEKVLVVFPENCEFMKAIGLIYVQLGQNEKALEIFCKAARIDPRDAQALSIIKKDGEEVPIKLLNSIGVLYFEKAEFELLQFSDVGVLRLQGNWNFFAAIRSEKIGAKLEATHLEKANELYTKVRSTVAELKNAVRAFSQLSAASSYHTHGFDEKKIETHVEYCKHLLDAAKIHCEVAEREEQQNRQRLELAYQVERRKHEDELKQLRQQKEHFDRVKEQWKFVSIPSAKRKERTPGEEDLS